MQQPFVEKYFKRFDASQRIQHLVLFLAFLGLGITGLPQLFADNVVAQGWLNLLGGGENARNIHHICGAAMIILSVYHVTELIVRALLGKGSLAMIPKPHDAKTVVQNIKYYLGLRKEPPEFDRYDYLEKMEYLALIWGNFIMALTGLMIWFPLITIKILPGQAIPVATAVHGWEAILAGAYVLIVHMYFAHFKPEAFPYSPMMTDGRISEHHLMEHHPKEYEKVTGHSASSHDTHNEYAFLPASEETPHSKEDTSTSQSAPEQKSEQAESNNKNNNKKNGNSKNTRESANEARRKAIQE